MIVCDVYNLYSLSESQELLRCLHLFLPLDRVTQSTEQSAIKNATWLANEESAGNFASPERVRRLNAFLTNDACFKQGSEHADQHGFQRSHWDELLEGLTAFLQEAASPESAIPKDARTKTFRAALRWTNFEMNPSEIEAAAEGALALADLRMTTLSQSMTMFRELPRPE